MCLFPPSCRGCTLVVNGFLLFLLLLLIHIVSFEKMQLREYIDDTEDYINIQVGDVETECMKFIG